MSENTATIRLSKAAREFNIGVNTIVDFLSKKGFSIGKDPNAKLSQEMYNFLMKEFSTEKHVKEEAKKIGLTFASHETITIEDKKIAAKEKEKELDELFIKNVSLEYEKKAPEAPKKAKETAPQEPPKKEVPPVKETKTKAKAEEQVAEEKKKKTTRKKEAEIPAPEAPEAVTAKEAEKPSGKPKAEIKILGKMDLGTVEKKPAKKGKAKKEEEKPKEKKKSAAAPPAEPVIEEPVPVDTAETAGPEVQEPPKEEQENFIRMERIVLEGPTILGTMTLPEPRKFEKKKPVASSSDEGVKGKKKKRKRME